VIPSPKPIINLNTLNKVNWHIKSDVLLSNNKVSCQVLSWHETLINEVAQFSRFLLAQKESKQSPEIVALAFWCRQSNLTTIRSEFEQLTSQKSQQSTLQGIGKVFHIAPANVDTVFFYSMLLSVLSGNENIVRISERSGELSRNLIELFKLFLVTTEAKNLSNLVSIIEYSAKDTPTTKALSQWCNLRIIWGGDSAIEAISAIESKTKQLCFPDRFSIGVIQLLEKDTPQLSTIVSCFIADFMPFNQQACSSPKALFWLNTDVSLQNSFILELTKQLAVNQQNSGISEQVERQINLQKILMLTKNEVIDKTMTQHFSNVTLRNIGPQHLTIHSGSFLLLSQGIKDINQLPFDDKLQTIGYFGLDNIQLKTLKVSNCKRVTPMGTALSFNHNWDGVNLLSALVQ